MAKQHLLAWIFLKKLKEVGNNNIFGKLNTRAFIVIKHILEHNSLCWSI